MRLIFDNIIYSKEKQGGISNYWFELCARALTKPDLDCHFYEEVNSISNLCRQRLAIPSQNLIIHTFKPLILARLSSLRVPFDGDFLYHSSFYRALSNRKSFTEVTTVHDFNHTYFSKRHRAFVHNYLKYGSIKRSEGIICVSQNTANDLYKIFGPLKKKQVAVIYNGVSDDYFPRPKFDIEANNFFKSYKIDAPYILFVGGRVGYKNFDFVIKLMKQLTNIKLVVVGNVFNKNESRIIDVDIMKNIIVTNHISNNNLNILYNHAHCLLYPSSYEGFGIPVIEAMRAGCPVVALNRSSIPEIANGCALLNDNLNIEAFKKSINSLYDTALREDYTQQGFQQAEKYSWDKCAKETFDFYKSVYK